MYVNEINSQVCIKNDLLWSLTLGALYYFLDVVFWTNSESSICACICTAVWGRALKRKTHLAHNVVCPCESTAVFLHTHQFVMSKGFLKLRNIWHRWRDKLRHVVISQRTVSSCVCLRQSGAYGHSTLQSMINFQEIKKHFLRSYWKGKLYL